MTQADLLTQGEKILDPGSAAMAMAMAMATLLGARDVDLQHIAFLEDNTLNGNVRETNSVTKLLRIDHAKTRE
ncbi:hypothetical protein G3480_27070 [Thiorhodococcus mannitoliphagus]|uniref:Uncharacterized protein n=1 Tax=Thiorhodococcus mannitoliphagus TaxID=329406 RepID=A0A6P1E1W9_9GAMM|nr:hypothetical protein [Thiorhodococcus mannitoliphagus]NEX23869.1 hypothetical protein [Thiorhodococcus mannitoliphagus]